MGPIGSGKSTACVMEIMIRSQEQKPSPGGKRKTRWAIIRNTYPELKTTTVKTWNDWCPAVYGNMTMSSPIRHHVVTADLDMEILFLALDKPEDQRKLLSLELTGAWVNESREISRTIVDTLTGRVGRYPSRNMGGCTWSGIIMDTNPPDDQSWWYKLSEEEVPDGWKFFKQPPGDGPKAENIPNLPKNYYKRIAAGKDPDWIKVYVRGDYGFVTEGKPVFPMYRDRIHASASDIVPVRDLPILLGIDFGLTPACVIAQKLVDGRWLILDEVCAEDSGVKQFAEFMAHYMASNYAEFEISGAWGDPAGTTRGLKEETAFDIMNEYFPLHKTNTSIKWREAPEEKYVFRLEAVKHALGRLVDGEPGLLLSPKCRTLRKGFAGGYHYKYVRLTNDAQVHEKPNKNVYSHVHDALQYLLLGGGEHQVVMRRAQRIMGEASNNKPIIVKDVDYKFFG